MSRVSTSLLLACALSLPLLGQTVAPQISNRTPATRGGRYDPQIQQEVSAELRKHDWAKDIRSSVEDGIVTLQGTVPLYIDKVRAYDKLHNKNHVQGVRNQIVVTGPTVPDTELSNRIAERLRYDRADRGITFNNFMVNVKDGVVSISGEARTPVDAESALAIVESTPGVKDVVDDVKILPPSPFDDQTRLAVGRAIYGHPSLQKYALDPQRPIRIVVDNGHVTLYGVVDSQADKQIAETQARTVPNVFSVDDKLVVASQQVK